jgi:hypothetical protein
MTFRQLRLGAGLAIAIAIAPVMAQAQPSAPEALGTSIAHKLFSTMDLKAVIQNAMTASGESLKVFTNIRPAWGQMAVDTLSDEFVADQPQIEAVMGHKLVTQFSIDELQAGDLIMGDPGVQAQIAAAISHTQPGPPRFAAQTLRAIQSPAGRSFMSKVSNFQGLMGQDTTNEMLAIVIPGWLQRFGQKAAEGERARAR